MNDYFKHIEIRPGKRSGQPCIVGTRITIGDILSYLSTDMTWEEIVSDFPELTISDIKAAIAYAADFHNKISIIKAS